jgi:hypothetical protein
MAYAIRVAIDDRNLDMPQGPQSIEHDAAPQQEAPTDHKVAAEGSSRAGSARTPPIVTAERVRVEVSCARSLTIVAGCQRIDVDIG